MKLKNMHLAGPTAGVSLMGLGLLFVTRLSGPGIPPKDGFKLDRALLKQSYELTQSSYMFPQQGALLTGGIGSMGRGSRRLKASDAPTFSNLALTSEGGSAMSTAQLVASFTRDEAMAAELMGSSYESPRGGRSYASFTRSPMGVGFAGAGVGAAVGSRIGRGSRGRIAEFPTSVAASSSVADGATIASSLPGVTPAADLTPMGSVTEAPASRVMQSSAEVASAATLAPALPAASATSVDLDAGITTPARTPVTTTAVSATAWASEAVVGGDVAPSAPTATRPTIAPAGPVAPIAPGTGLIAGTPTVLRFAPPPRVVPVPPVQLGSPAPALVTPEPSTIALLGAGLAAMIVASRRRRSAI